MKRLLLAIPFVIALSACPGDRREIAQDSGTVVDTMPVDTVDLGSITANIPPVDTGRPAPREPRPSAPTIPNAPAPLMEAVRREATSSQFCFTEYGQKVDPSLRGSVNMLVTVGESGVTRAQIGASQWQGSRSAGQAVNRCLVERAERAWTLAPGAVRPGQYLVPMTFTGG
jgi:hypothetical protein